MLWNKYLLDNKKVEELIENKEEELKKLENKIYSKKFEITKKGKENISKIIKRRKNWQKYLKKRLKRKRILNKIYISDYYNIKNLDKKEKNKEYYIKLELNKQKYKFKAENWKRITPILLKNENNLYSISKTLPKIKVKDKDKEDFNNLLKNMKFSLLLITEEKLRLKLMMEEEIRKNIKYDFFVEEENKILIKNYIIELRNNSEKLFFIDTMLLQLQEENFIFFNENYQFNYHQLLMDRELLEKINDKIDLNLILDDYDNIKDNDQEDIISEMLYQINIERMKEMDLNLLDELNLEEQKEIELNLELERFY